MAHHDDLLEQGPREAPEPETAEQRTTRNRRRAVGGGVLGGGAAVAKLGALGGLGKAFIWLIAWNSFTDAGHIFGWLGVLTVAAVLVGYLVLRSRRARHE